MSPFFQMFLPVYALFPGAPAAVGPDDDAEAAPGKYKIVRVYGDVLSADFVVSLRIAVAPLLGL